MFARGLPRRGRWLGALLTAALAVTLSPLTAHAHPGHDHAESDAKVLIFTKTTQFRHSEAITQGTPVLQEAFSAAGIDSVHTEDSAVFTDAGLAEYDALVMFQTSGDPWTADQKAALERYTQAGGGIVAIHNATDMRGGYTWWDNLVGALMPGHAATGTSPGLPGTVRVEDRTHPSTTHLPQRWNRADEWYNFSRNVRGEAHVLATMDESTYAPGSNAMGYDHPISWCKPYDGGRAWVTGMGHFGAHYTGEPNLVQHIVGGVKWAAGVEEGDCGGTVWETFEKVTLDENTSAPFAMDVAPDGRVFYTELVRGQVRVYDPTTRATTTALTLPVYSGGEDGLLGIALAPDFATSGHLYVYYSPESSNNSDPANFFSRVSRFTMQGNTIDPASEKVVLTVPARRLPDEPGHTGGGLDFDAQGNLYLGVGDDVNPHSEPSGGYAPLSTRDGTFHDARETSANTNDLRGKLLRIHPEPDGTYTIPEGNLFPPGTEKTRPEIYAMGFRNPFRFTVDPQTGWVGMADYSPDNSNDAPTTRGPAGIAEWNLIKAPGNYGWPLCMGNNEPFRDVDYGRTSAGPVVVGDFFDCSAPVNDSPRNTGLVNLPPAQPADMWYGYKRSSVPSVIPQGGGLAPMGGPFYDYDPTLVSDTKFPASFEGKPFFYDWARNKMYSIDLKNPAGAGSQVEKVNPFLPQEQFLAPIDSKFGPDGSLYVLDWGGGYGRDNPNSGLHRIDYVSGSRSPSAAIDVSTDSGQAPLAVSFDGSGSTDPENETLTFAWDFDGDGTTDSSQVAPTHTYTANGVFDARLTVTDPHGKVGTTTVPITVGNTRPEVSFNLPPEGSFFDFGDDISWDVTATDPEDGTVAGEDVVIQPALGHDGHAHPTTPLSGLTGSTPTSLGGHGEEENIFFAIDARYSDAGGAGGTPSLTGSDTTLVFPKQKQAEFHSSSSGTATVAARDIEGGGSVVVGSTGDWAAYDPVNLHRVDQLGLRVSSPAGGTVELRRGAVDGPLLGTAQVPATGSSSSFVDVATDVADPGGTFALYLVFKAGEVRVNFIEAIGQGASPTTKPVVRITSPTTEQVLAVGDVTVSAEATDAQNTVTQVEFLVDGVSVGTDDTAPFTATWSPTADGRYQLTAVATNDQGASTTSRIVLAQVGELFGDLETFSNADGEFEQLGENRYAVSSAGANMWQATDEYSSLYLPAGADTDWTATVKVVSQTNSNGSAKAGLIVRNDVTAPGQSAGYAALGIRPANGFEWLRSSGNGQLNSSTGASTTGYPAWVRITRNGDQYTAYWSKDGEKFTQIGLPETLPGAAAVQDIGMFVTAHSTTARSDVVFEDFVFDTTPAEPEPPVEPQVPLTCPGPLTDEFNGTSLDRARWTAVRQPTGTTVSVAGGSLVLPVAAGDINEGSTGPLGYVGQPLPTGAWEASTKVSLAHGSHWQYAGLLVHKTDDEYTKLAFVKHSNGGRFLEFQTETAGARTTHGAFTVPAGFPTTVHLKLVSSGTSVTAFYSTDGTAWTKLNGTAPLKTDATIGLVGAGDVGTTPNTAAFDWFRFAPDRVRPTPAPADEFDGTALDGCRWDRTVRYDSNTAKVTSGELRVTTQPGDIDGGNSLSPRNFILQDVPEGDWVAQTRLKASFLHQWQYAGLLAYGSDDDYVKLDVVATNAPGSALNLRAEAVSETSGSFGGGGNRSIDIAETTESGWWYLRLVKEGSSYTGYISDGGVNWTPLGAPVTHTGNLSAFGLVAVGPQQQTPITVAFDYFHVSAVDAAAPTTTLTLTPAEPDGRNGWYWAGPAFALTADDGDGSGVATTEYRLDGGAWTAYAGSPVTVQVDGEHTVEYRSTDAAGNVEAAGSRVVKVDGTTPITDAATSGTGGTVTVTLSAQDATSGVATTQYRIDGGDWTDWTGTPVSVTGDGDHVVEYLSTDVAGNEESVKAVTVSVDGTGPTIVVTGAAHGQVYGDSELLTVGWEARDAGSGVASVSATLDGAPVQPGTELVLADLFLGLHDLVVTATDQAGNASTQKVTFGTATSFVDMAELVRRYEAAGFVSAAGASDLVDQLDKASREAIKGKKSKAVSALVQFHGLVDRLVTDAHARTVLHRDADAMIVRLGGTPSRSATAGNQGRTLAGAGLLAGDPTTREVAALE